MSERPEHEDRPVQPEPEAQSSPEPQVSAREQEGAVNAQGGPEAPGGAGEPGAGATTGGAANAAGVARQAVPLEAVATRDILLWIVGVLGGRAWQGMGLIPNPATGKIDRDLEDARIAIDAASALFEVLRPRLDEATRRETEQLLTTLRLNFVEKSAGA